MKMVKTPEASVCSVCGTGPTIDAHLFPRALGHDLRGREKHLFVGAVAAPGRRTVQAGLFDPGILCGAHEAELGPYDTYAIEFFRTFRARCQHPAPNIWRVHGADGDQLTRFWVAVLWRFGVSRLREAGLVNLGPFADRLRDILFSHTPCSVEPAVIMCRYRSRVMRPENICFPPYASKFPMPPSLHGVPSLNAYGIAVAGFQAFVKLDDRPLPPMGHALTINGKAEITGGYIEFETTEQFRRMLQVANNMAQKPNPRRAERHET